MKEVSIREFARLDACDESLVRRRVKHGFLPTPSNGKIDSALVGTGWCERNIRRIAAGADTPADRGADSKVSAPAQARRRRASAPEIPDGETVEAAARRLAEAEVFSTKAEAERHKESYLAHLRRLEFGVKRGDLVSIEDVGVMVEAEYSVMRERALTMPGKLAGRLEIQSREKILEELRLEVNESCLSSRRRAISPIRRARSGRNAMDRPRKVLEGEAAAKYAYRFAASAMAGTPAPKSSTSWRSARYRPLHPRHKRAPAPHPRPEFRRPCGAGRP